MVEATINMFGNRGFLKCQMGAGLKFTVDHLQNTSPPPAGVSLSSHPAAPLLPPIPHPNIANRDLTDQFTAKNNCLRCGLGCFLVM